MALTWPDISSFVAEEMQKEGAKPNRVHYLMLGNVALGIISRVALTYQKSWTDGASPFILSGNSYPLPEDLIEIERVEWGATGSSNELEKVSEGWLDQEQPGWRDQTADTPGYYTTTSNHLLLNVNPTGTVTGYLTIRGFGLLPEFSDTVGATNPLEYLARDQQITPAYYVLAELPADMTDPNQQARVQKFGPKWAAALLEIEAQARRRREERFSY